MVLISAFIIFVQMYSKNKMEIEKLYTLFLESKGVTTDTRTCADGLIFFALKGERFNGNSFALQALEKGCRYAVIDEKEYYDDTNPKLILVENVLLTLQKLARHHREQLNTPVIGITGTNGKTTTKELIAAVMYSTYNTHFTKGNLNNSIGVPLTLLQLKPEHQYAIIEMGASHPGDIEELVNVCKPNYGIITNVGKAHLLGFGSFEGVIKTKGELYDYLRANGGHIFINGKNNYLLNIAEGLENTMYGVDSNLYVNGNVIECAPHLKLQWRIADGAFSEIQTQLIGSYNIENVLAAITIGLYFGVDAAKINESIAAYAPQNNRSQLTVTEHNRLIVDAYNANPTSMKAALDNFALVKADDKVLILGDMRELGESGREEHQSVLKLIAEYGFSDVYLVGSEFAAAQAEQAASYHLYNNIDELIEYVKQSPLNGKTILIKGSNSIGLTEIVNYL